jgi:hypothetical protein
VKKLPNLPRYDKITRNHDPCHNLFFSLSYLSDAKSFSPSLHFLRILTTTTHVSTLGTW